MSDTRAVRAVNGWLKGETHPDDSGPRTQVELARRCSEHLGRNLNQASISNIVSEKRRSMPRTDLAAALKHVLGIELEWWLEEVPASSHDVTEPTEAKAEVA